ncbi:DUF4394 domain-containing protein [Frigidibacter sp. MR17.24]|uniref:DUF4394 domain-containing protein n=1 Tax=Frigidibacter sp. MR17.24 TaxID=3127345 RepID=UPI003012FAF9
MTTFRTMLLAGSALALTAPAALAAPVIALLDSGDLVSFDTGMPAEVTMIEVTGAEDLVGIDLRPANNTLVGVTAAGGIVTIDPATGAATDLSTMTTMLPASDMPVIVDFNPMADRLRLMTGTTNHRVNVDTGEVTVDGSLAFESGDMHAGEAPAIAAAAYINAYGKPEKTAMYDIDTTIGALIRQTSPNDGTLAAIGKLGIEMGDSTPAFDIQTTADGTNSAWLMVSGTIYAVDLETGAATEAVMVEGIEGDVIDFTVMPAM